MTRFENRLLSLCAEDQSFTAVCMAFLYFHQREFLNAYLKGRLEKSVQHAWLMIEKGVVDDAVIADVTELPLDAIHALKTFPSDYLKDLEDYSEVFDVNGEMLSEWHRKTWLEGLRACVNKFFKERFGPLPPWAKKKLDEADEKDLAYWLREGGRYKNLEALLLSCDMADQILMHEPPHWEVKPFLKGVRRVLRIQVIEKFSVVPFWFDERIAEAGYEELIGLIAGIRDAKTLTDLIQDAEISPKNQEG